MKTTQNLEQSRITESIYLYKHKELNYSLINSLLNFVNTQKLDLGAIGSGNHNKNIRNVSILNITESFENYINLTKIINETLYDYLKSRTQGKFVGLPLEFDIEVLQYLRYTPGGHYVEHVDKFYGCAGEHGDRVFTAIVYLNDDYSGGRLKFPYNNISLKPEAGSILVFPSTWEHCHLVEPVYRGVRHSMVSWYLDINLT